MLKLRLFGLALAAVAMLTIAGCKNNKSAEQASLNNSDTLETNDPFAEFSDNNNDNNANANANQTPAVSDNNSEEPVMSEDKNGNLSEVPDTKVSESNVFYIVAGSFTLYNNAQKLNTKLKAKGYDSKILEPYGQYHRVTVKQFKTVAEARAALPELRKNVDQTLWLLTR